MSLQVITQLPAFPVRPLDGHKGTFGKVLLWGGSFGMTGAAVLAGRAALRSGAGLAYIAAPRSCVPTIAGGEPSYLTLPLPEDSCGQTTAEAGEFIRQHLALMQAAAIGPGLGRSPVLDQLVLDVYATSPLPCVIDADALNVLADHPEHIAAHVGPRILTPHPGEFSRLTGTTIAAIAGAREDQAAMFAARHNVVVVLKGRGTVITDGRQIYINTTGNPGMATGGSGDVLTGVILALLGQGLELFAAAQLGVYLHGLAGDFAARDLTQPGLIAADLPDYLPEAIAEHEVDRYIIEK